MALMVSILVLEEAGPAFDLPRRSLLGLCPFWRLRQGILAGGIPGMLSCLGEGGGIYKAHPLLVPCWPGLRLPAAGCQALSPSSAWTPRAPGALSAAWRPRLPVILGIPAPRCPLLVAVRGHVPGGFAFWGDSALWAGEGSGVASLSRLPHGRCSLRGSGVSSERGVSDGRGQTGARPGKQPGDRETRERLRDRRPSWPHAPGEGPTGPVSGPGSTGCSALQPRTRQLPVQPGGSRPSPG